VNSLDVGFEARLSTASITPPMIPSITFGVSVDPTFEYGVALAKVAGRLMLRAAQAQLLPAREGDFVASVAGYDEELHSSRTACVRRPRIVEIAGRGCVQIGRGPTKPRAAPPRAAEVPYLNFAELDNAIAKLHRAPRHSTRNMRASGHR